MTTFTDYVRNKHFDQYRGQEIDMDDDFNQWKDNLSTDDLAGYMIEYTTDLGITQYAKFAYSVLQSNN